VTLRRGLPHLIALILGIGAALLAACGSSTRGGIPAADASDLKGQLEDVRTRVAGGNCDGLARELRDVNTSIDALPRSVDNRLVSALRNGADRLQTRAVQDCNNNRAATQTTTTPPDTTPTQTQTETTPTPTATTPPETTTTPPDTTTQPPTTTLPPEPPQVPVPPPPPVVSPGGGTPPTVP
jgi:septal ring-binding cell division protein DamX